MYIFSIIVACITFLACTTHSLFSSNIVKRTSTRWLLTVKPVTALQASLSSAIGGGGGGEGVVSR